MLKNGTILEIPLKKDFGYAYGKLLYLDIDINNIIDTELIIKIYNLYSAKQINLIPEDFKNIDYKPQSILPMDKPKLRGKNKWKIIGSLDVLPDDEIVPEFKSNYSIINADYNTDISSLDWFTIRNLDPTNNSKVNNYNDIKHLGTYIQLRQELIAHKLTFDSMFQKGINPLHFYTKDDFENIIGLSMMYAISKSEV
ncbi:Imm26 family immunity protein [Marinifilum fragile]|uniref:Imm26 family immunity protein n=1 Tax=Marinifilum fragile TaxID=570161 RepID=UPI002AAAC906|nr:Imm26 family immunity protein [Marinifilum fragile]